MKVRIVSPGWETYTGPMGLGVRFENGESTTELTKLQIGRIGGSLQIIDIESGEQVGPGATHRNSMNAGAHVIAPLKTQMEEEQEAEVDSARLVAEEAARKEAEDVALAAAKEKAATAAASTVWTRAELEAMAANDGIEGVRVVAEPLGVKGRSITDLVNGVLNAQAVIAAE